MLEYVNSEIRVAYHSYIVIYQQLKTQYQPLKMQTINDGAKYPS